MRFPEAIRSRGLGPNEEINPWMDLYDGILRVGQRQDVGPNWRK
jgi:hypothetical protein